MAPGKPNCRLSSQTAAAVPVLPGFRGSQKPRLPSARNRISCRKPQPLSLICMVSQVSDQWSRPQQLALFRGTFWLLQSPASHYRSDGRRKPNNIFDLNRLTPANRTVARHFKRPLLYPSCPRFSGQPETPVAILPSARNRISCRKPQPLSLICMVSQVSDRWSMPQ